MNTDTFSLATLAPAIPEILLLVLVSAIVVADLFIAERAWYAIRVWRGDKSALAYLRGDYNVAR